MDRTADRRNDGCGPESRNAYGAVRRIAIPAFLILVLSSVSFADACEVATTFFVEGDLTATWGMRAAIALALSSLFVALFYMIAKGLGKPELANRAKTDFNQVLMTGLILVIFSAFVGGICAIDATQFGLPKSSLFENSKSYFEYGRSVAMDAYVKTANAIMIVSGLASIFTRPTLLTSFLGPSISFGISPFAGFNSALSALQFMMNIVLTTVVLSSAWIAVSTAIEGAFLQLLLPAGVLLRCLMPTRELGGVLIAIAIGFFVFYPLLFSIAYLVIGTPGEKTVSEPDYAGTLISAFTPLAVAGIIPLAGVFAILWEYLFLSDMVGDTIIDGMRAIGGALMPIFILPAICWVIIAELVRNMSRALGEEIDIGTLARMV